MTTDSEENWKEEWKKSRDAKFKELYPERDGGKGELHITYFEKKAGGTTEQFRPKTLNAAEKAVLEVFETFPLVRYDFT